MIFHTQRIIEDCIFVADCQTADIRLTTHDFTLWDREIDSGKNIYFYKLTTAPGEDEPQPMKISTDNPPLKDSHLGMECSCSRKKKCKSLKETRVIC